MTHKVMIPPHYRYLRGYMEDGQFKIGWKGMPMTKNDRYRFWNTSIGRKIKG